MKKTILLLCSILCLMAGSAEASPEIFVNQVAFDSNSSKIAVVSLDKPLGRKTVFYISGPGLNRKIAGVLSGPYELPDSQPGKYYYLADFSTIKLSGKYQLVISIDNVEYQSPRFNIGAHALEKLTVPAIVHYYNKQRANTAQELAADSKVKLFGSTDAVDMRGGWCDASGDVSKYLSHLAYANFMSPQQIPLVTWSLAGAAERLSAQIVNNAGRDSLRREALYGADYLVRALSKEGYFRMIIFSYFNKDPDARRVVGLHANSVTTNEYQAAFREGGGMAIAALAHVARWKQHGAYSSAQYLEAAERAFAHLLINNTKYDDDGKENIIDDYCALMAATELWINTNKVLYRNEARKRSQNLSQRLTKQDYFIADSGDRPFWHASDAGLPVVALCKYLTKETDPALRRRSLLVIRKNLEYIRRVTDEVANPFGYARQTFSLKGKVKEGFFIPHDNETGWWWQGENARLASLATAALEGSKLLYAADKNIALRDSLKTFAQTQISWILGCNPYGMCFMYGFGVKNVPYMHSNFGHGSEKGGISNGVTGKTGNPDGSGIEFKTEDNGNEWRWTEQWIPHSAWFLAALTALSNGD
jgi:hypothetical protein